MEFVDQRTAIGACAGCNYTYLAVSDLADGAAILPAPPMESSPFFLKPLS